MPYSKLSDSNIKKVSGVAITLAQANEIAAMADAIGGENAWAIAISNFKKSHKIDNGKWIKSKEISDNFAIVSKEEDGRYLITAISTAALKDKEEETFTTQAMDYEIQRNKSMDDYPEFRVFHCDKLGIGKVEKMSRVGIFAIDQGHSYTDPFSIDICEKMLKDNKDGKWKISRGFYVLEAAGGCPNCGADIGVRTKHLAIGFTCPVCKSYYRGFKRALNDVRFLKTKTFDITITDIPCNPYTGVVATKSGDIINLEDILMNKKQLKEKLLSAGISEDAVNERLKEFTDEQLKEFDKIPEAALLKEIASDMEDEEEEEVPDEGEEKSPAPKKSPKSCAKESKEETLILDDSVMKEFRSIVKEEIVSALDGIEFEADMGDIQSKEISSIEELLTIVKEIQETLETLSKKDSARLKEILDEAPRNGKLRVMRMKSERPLTDEELSIIRGKEKDEDSDSGVIKDSNGSTFKSMTEFVSAGGNQ